MNSIQLSHENVNAAPASSIVARWESYKYGWDIFTAGEPLERCQNAQQRNGWWNALNAAADSDTYSFLVGDR